MRAVESALRGDESSRRARQLLLSAARLIVLEARAKFVHHFAQVADLLAQHDVVRFELELALDATNAAVEGVAAVLERATLLLDRVDHATVVALKMGVEMQ